MYTTSNAYPYISEHCYPLSPALPEASTAIGIFKILVKKDNLKKKKKKDSMVFKSCI